MTVVITMQNGDKHHLDRRLYLENVAQEINEGRNHCQLIRFELDRTPTGQYIWIDPNLVVHVISDRSGY